MGQNAHAKFFVIGPKFTGVFSLKAGRIVVDHLVFHIEIYLHSIRIYSQSKSKIMHLR